MSTMIPSDPAKLPALFEALALAQGEFAQIAKSTTVSIRPKDASKSPYSFKYADLQEILDAVRPFLSARGLCLVQPVMTDEAGKSWLVTAVCHKDGGVLESRVEAPAPTEDPKQYGGLITFMRRYMVNSILCLASDDDLDDDGAETQRSGGYTNARPLSGHRPAIAQPAATTGAVGVISSGQAAWLANKFKALGIAPDSALARFKVASLAELDGASFDTLKSELAKA